MEKIKTFVQEHKKEIFVIGGSIFVIAGIVILGKSVKGLCEAPVFIKTDAVEEFNEIVRLANKNELKGLFIVAEDTKGDIHYTSSSRELMRYFVDKSGPAIVKAYDK